MVCPDCGSIEVLRESGSVFCMKCGLELDELVYSKHGKSFSQAVDLEKVDFCLDPKQELYALKLGFKNRKLADNWPQMLGFSINSALVNKDTEHNALEFIQNAYANHSKELMSSKARIEGCWSRINNKYFIEIEKLFNIKWPARYFKCYLTLSTKFGYHNSSKNFIIIQHSLDKISNYVIAHELFHIMYRNYISRFFKEKYIGPDNSISKVLAAFVLLTHPKIKACFSDMAFSFNIFTDEYESLAKKLWPIWQAQKPFKEFMIDTYKELNIEKTWVSY